MATFGTPNDGAPQDPVEIRREVTAERRHLRIGDDQP